MDAATKCIAERLGISFETVRTHVKKVYDKPANCTEAVPGDGARVCSLTQRYAAVERLSQKPGWRYDWFNGGLPEKSSLIGARIRRLSSGHRTCPSTPCRGCGGLGRLLAGQRRLHLGRCIVRFWARSG